MKTQDVRTYTEQRLRWLQNLPDNQRRAELAKLRRGVGAARQAAGAVGEFPAGNAGRLSG